VPVIRDDLGASGTIAIVRGAALPAGPWLNLQFPLRRSAPVRRRNTSSCADTGRTRRRSRRARRASPACTRIAGGFRSPARRWRAVVLGHGGHIPILDDDRQTVASGRSPACASHPCACSPRGREASTTAIDGYADGETPSASDSSHRFFAPILGAHSRRKFSAPCFYRLIYTALHALDTAKQPLAGWGVRTRSTRCPRPRSSPPAFGCRGLRRIGGRPAPVGGKIRLHRAEMHHLPPENDTAAPMILPRKRSSSRILTMHSLAIFKASSAVSDCEDRSLREGALRGRFPCI
jgi:hypothetical protein